MNAVDKAVWCRKTSDSWLHGSLAHWGTAPNTVLGVLKARPRATGGRRPREGVLAPLRVAWQAPQPRPAHGPCTPGLHAVPRPVPPACPPPRCSGQGALSGCGEPSLASVPQTDPSSPDPHSPSQTVHPQSAASSGWFLLQGARGGPGSPGLCTESSRRASGRHSSLRRDRQGAEAGPLLVAFPAPSLVTDVRPPVRRAPTAEPAALPQPPRPLYSGRRGPLMDT